MSISEPDISNAILNPASKTDQLGQGNRLERSATVPIDISHKAAHELWSLVLICGDALRPRRPNSENSISIPLHEAHPW